MIRACGILSLLCVAALAASGARAGERQILRIYAWSEFFDGDVLAEFEERHDCMVAVNTFDSNEGMLRELRDDASPPYDIVTPSSYITPEMKRQGMLLPIERALIPNLRNLDADYVARFSEDPEFSHSVPYARTVAGIGHNASLPRDAARSWSLFGDPRFAGRMTMLDDMRESMGAALKHLGHSLNSTDPGELAEAGRVLAAWGGNIAKFEVDEGNIGLMTGEYVAAHGYNGDVLVLMAEHENIGFFVPEEGSAVSTDVFVVLASSRGKDLAHAFINHMLDADVAARNMASIQYYMPIPEAVAKLDASLQANPAFAVPAATIEKCEVIRDLGPDTEKYEQVWKTVVTPE